MAQSRHDFDTGHVRFQGQSGRRMVLRRESAYDPKRTFSPQRLRTRDQPGAVFASLWISSLQMQCAPNPDEEVPDGSILVQARVVTGRPASLWRLPDFPC